MSKLGRIRMDGSHNRPGWLEIGDQAVRVASDGTHVFWVTGFDAESATTHVGRVNADGTSKNETWVTLGGLTFPFFIMDLVTDGTYLYLMVVETESEGSNAERTFIARIKISNGVLDLEWHTASIDPAYQHLAVGAGHLYWTREISVSESWVARMKTDGTGLEPEWIKVGEGFHPALTADSEFLWAKMDNGLSRATLAEGSPVFTSFYPEAEILEAAGEPTLTHVFLGIFKEGAPASPSGSHAEGYLYYCLQDFEVEEEEAEEREEASTTVEQLSRSAGTQQGSFGLPHVLVSYAPVEMVYEEPEEGEEPEEEVPTNVVKVKAGGELIDGRRYVKAGGELVPT